MGQIDNTQLMHDESEKACIGAVLQSPEAYHMVAYLTPEDFWGVRYRWAWQAVGELVAENKHIDVTTVSERWQQLAKTADSPLVWMMQCLSSAPYLEHLPTYAETVKGYSVRRQVLKTADVIKQLAVNLDVLPDALIQQWVEAGNAIKSHTPGEMSFKDMVMSRFERAEQLINNANTPSGIPSGLIDLDSITSGFHNGDLIVLAGRPGMGKTAAMVTFMLNQIRAGHRIGFFSLEMNWQSLIDRMIAMVSGLSSEQTRNPQRIGNGEQWKKYVEAMGELYNLGDRIVINDKTQMTVQQMLARASVWKASGGLDMLYCDYLQIMGSTGQYEGRTAETGAFARGMKQLARDLNIPVLVGSQLSRAVEQRADKRPMLSDLRESGEIEQEADIVAFIYRDAYYNELTESPNQADFIIAKHRNGATGTASCYYMDKQTLFVNGTTREYSLRGER